MHSIFIRKPQREVFLLVSRPDLYLDIIDSDVIEIERTGNGRPGWGDEYRELTRTWFGADSVSMACTEYVPPKRISFEAKGRSFEAETTMRFIRRSTGTVLRVQRSTRPTGLWRLLSPITGAEVERRWQGRLAQLKAKLESGELSHHTATPWQRESIVSHFTPTWQQ